MRGSVLELFGGAFIFTAITYSTGKAYFNSYFRTISIEPSLIDLSIDQIFFEGGRQLVSLLTSSLLEVLVISLAYLAARTITSATIERNLSTTNAETTKKILSSMKNISLTVFFLWFSTYTFNSAIASGKIAGSEAGCIPATVYTTSENIETMGCLVHKTIDNVWIKYKKNGETLTSIFPRDNFYKIETGPRLR